MRTGEPVSTARVISVSPQRPEDVVVDEADVPAAFVAEAADRARRAQRAWLDLATPARAQVLSAAADAARADELTALMGVVGNDVSSRSIEGENPLYLPQAKVFTGSCALGPALVPVQEVPPLPELAVRLEIRRDDEVIFGDEVSLAALRRTPVELLGWLFQALDFPAGVVLLTGTSIVPPPELTLAAGDVVRIAVPGVGTLVNPVEVVGTARPRVVEEVRR